MFEVISKEEFEGSGATPLGATVAYGGERMTVPVAPDNAGVGTAPSPPTPALIWCDFCKGHYNEYHYGDIDEPSR